MRFRNEEEKNREHLKFEFNNTGKKAEEHFAEDVKKLADCEGANTLLFIFMRDKTFSDEAVVGKVDGTVN